MLYGDPPPDLEPGEGAGWATAALLVPIAVLVVLGLLLPEPLSSLMRASAGVLVP
jgi:hypothetical protein